MELDKESLRRRWFEKSGAKELSEKSTLTYQGYVSKIQDSILEIDQQQIDLDVPRAKVSLFKYVLRQHSANEDSDLPIESVSASMEVVRNILSAYALRNPRIGYIQGHADVVSFILGVVGDHEETVFWIYSFVVERIFPVDFFARNPKLQGFHVDMELFAALISQKMPRIREVLSDDDVFNISSLLAFKWFISIWVRELQFNDLVSVWDEILTSDLGNITHLVLAMSILDICQEDILQYAADDDCDASIIYKMILEKGSSLGEIHSYLLPTAEKYDLSEAEIEEMREEIRAIPQFVEQEINALNGITHFSKAQLESLQVEFRILKEASRRRGNTIVRGIDRETLLRVLGRVIPEWPPESYTQLVDVLDADSLGTVDFQRLMLALSVLCKGTVEEKLNLCFNIYDSNKKGYLDVKDLILMAGSLSKIYQYKMIGNSSPQIDPLSGGDGTPERRSRANSSADSSALTVQDSEHMKSSFLRRLVSSTAFINRLLCMDIDGDRRLSHSEWLQGAVAEPHVLRCFVSPPNNKSSVKMHKRSRSSDMRQSAVVTALKVQEEIDITLHEKGTEEPVVTRRISLLSPRDMPNNINCNQGEDTTTRTDKSSGFCQACRSCNIS